MKYTRPRKCAYIVPGQIEELAEGTSVAHKAVAVSARGSVFRLNTSSETLEDLLRVI